MKIPSALSPTRHSSVFKRVAIGMACASYWRGAWYILDDQLYPQNTFYSAVASLGLGTVGLALCEGFAARSQNCRKISSNQLGPSFFPSSLKFLTQWRGPIMRFGALYCVSTSCILVWRGAWLLWDVVYEEGFHYYINSSTLTEKNDAEIKERHDQIHQLMANHNHSHHHTIGQCSNCRGHGNVAAALNNKTSANSKKTASDAISATDPHHLSLSGLLSHGIATVGLLALGRFASVLAPPARVSIAKDTPLYAKTAKEYMKKAKWLVK